MGFINLQEKLEKIMMSLNFAGKHCPMCSNPQHNQDRNTVLWIWNQDVQKRFKVTKPNLQFKVKNRKQKKKKMGTDYRLLVVSSRARNKVAIFNSVLPNLVLVDYNYEMTTLDELLSVWFSKKYLCSYD